MEWKAHLNPSLNVFLKKVVTMTKVEEKKLKTRFLAKKNTKGAAFAVSKEGHCC